MRHSIRPAIVRPKVRLGLPALGVYRVGWQMPRPIVNQAEIVELPSER